MDLKSKLRHVMDFPKEGIDFIDITTVLQDAEAFKQALDEMKERLAGFGDFDVIVGSEARGFIFGAPLAYVMGKGFVPIRKRVNCLINRFLLNMSWNMAPIYWKCTRMP